MKHIGELPNNEKTGAETRHLKFDNTVRFHGFYVTFFQFFIINEVVPCYDTSVYSS